MKNLNLKFRDRVSSQGEMRHTNVLAVWVVICFLLEFVTAKPVSTEGKENDSSQVKKKKHLAEKSF